MTAQTFEIVDLFCGAGGATTGVYQAASALGVKLRVVAINHWRRAVETHQRNHTDAKHLCMSVESVDPRTVVPSGHLDLLLAGPECTHHSNARGGRPIHDQSRASAWNILRWCELLRVDHVLIENVPEFQTWGPLGANNRPLKRRKGETYAAFIRSLESLGYHVEARVLNAADFGDATTRKRLFIQARRRGAIEWPEPSHSRAGGHTLLRDTARWRGAREVIDWTVPSKSIFNRERPLSDKTLRRIEIGLTRFSGRPFVLQQQSGGVARSTEDPLPTIATDGAISMVEPFLVPPRNFGAGSVDSVERPLRTITAAAGHTFGLVEPFIITPGGADLRNGRSVSEPLPTVTCTDRFALVEPFLVPLYGERKGQAPRTHSVDEPVPTIPASGGGKFGLVVTMRGSEDSQLASSAASLEDPLRTISARGTHHGLVEVEPFTMPYCSNGGALARPVTEPMGTITTRDRLALVIPEGMDIRFRMLQPHELSAAMGFPADYAFSGTKGDVIRQIGNAWACRTATALCRTILSGALPARQKRRRTA